MIESARPTYYVQEQLKISKHYFKKVFGRPPVVYISISGKLRTIDKTVDHYQHMISVVTQILEKAKIEFKLVGCTDLDHPHDENKKIRLVHKDRQQFHHLSEQQRLEIMHDKLNFDYFKIQDTDTLPENRVINRMVAQQQKFLDSFPDFNFDVVYKTRFDLLLHNQADPAGILYVLTNIAKMLNHISRKKYQTYVLFRNIKMLVSQQPIMDLDDSNQISINDHDFFACADSVKHLNENLYTLVEQHNIHQPERLWIYGLGFGNGKCRIGQTDQLGEVTSLIRYNEKNT